ncbi:hypothetical protein TSMEX_007600 [Taenia solium]|eukprot:TsM_001138200 transcript=TsM_001138200 gene=TsM_001138200
MWLNTTKIHISDDPKPEYVASRWAATILAVGRDATHMLAMAAMEGMLLTAVDIMDVLEVVDLVVAAVAVTVGDASAVAVATPAFHACGIVEDGLKPSDTTSYASKVYYNV